jgi:putative hydrolase of the HAD superfamily
MIRGVLFDLGSTLIRFTGDWGAVLEEGIQAMCLELQRAGLRVDGRLLGDGFRREMELYHRERQVDYLERTMGPVLRRSLQAAGLQLPGGDVEARALEAFYRATETYWQLMPGAHALLDTLRKKGLRLAIVSNAADQENVERLIDRASLRPWFDPIIVSAAVGVRKPHPRIFGQVLQAWNIPPAELVMVGDTLGEDILGAQRVHLHQVWLTAEADTPANRALSGVVVPECEAATLAGVETCLARLNGSSV